MRLVATFEIPRLELNRAVSGTTRSFTLTLADRLGVDGKSPYIGTNGHWWVGDSDLGVSVSGMAVIKVANQQAAIAQSAGNTTDLFVWE